MSHIELEDLESYWVYDIETYCNCFTFTVIRADLKEAYVFEISFRKNNITELLAFLKRLKHSNDKLVGFNNQGFDYPVIHFIIETGPSVTAYDIFDEAQRLIESNDEDRFRNNIKNPHVKQVDLYKIHHFDNNAKRTSLKILKFNMRTDELQDLPYDIFEALTSDQIDKLIEYNINGS